MCIEISLLPAEKKHVLRNMLELYLHDFSEVTTDDDSLELNDAGLYGYCHLDHYWTEESRWPYIVTLNGKLAGFSMVRLIDSEPLTFEIAEFFVVRRYRRSGIGRAMIDRMFELHKGNWQIDTPKKNVTAQPFWRAAVQRQTSDYVEELVCNGQRLQWRFTNAGN